MVDIEQPFVYTYRLFNRYFFYEVNNNSVCEVSKKNFEIINKLIQAPHALLEDEVKIIKKIKDLGWLQSTRPEKIENSENLYFKNYLQTSIKNLTLQVTQNCNLNCKYCSFSGRGFLNRQKSHNDMSWQVAKKAIDFYIEHSRDYPKGTIAFYGGEPFLNYNLIIKCINYLEEKNRGKENIYFITTNGTILNEKIITLLNQYNIHLTISLDGNQELHNKNRRFAEDGSGSYDKIINNIEILREKCPRAFKKLTINSVIDQSEDYDEYANYFKQNNLFEELVHSCSTIDTQKIEPHIITSSQYKISKKKEEICNYISYYTKRINSSLTDNLSMLDEKFSFEMPFQKKYHHGGPCVPGVLRLFVDINGKFYSCEKISENSQTMCIGDINTGFDYENIYKIMNIGNMTINKCKKCIALRHCNICANQCDNINELSLQLKLFHCNRVLKEMKRALRQYTTLGLCGVYKIYQDCKGLD